MDIVQYAEEILGLKLYPYQKIILKQLKGKGEIYYPYAIRNRDSVNYEWAKELKGFNAKAVFYDDCADEGGI